MIILGTKEKERLRGLCESLCSEGCNLEEIVIGYRYIRLDTSRDFEELRSELDQIASRCHAILGTVAAAKEILK